MKESNTRRINIEKHTHPTEFIYSCEQTNTQYIMFGTITNSIRRKILESKKKKVLGTKGTFIFRYYLMPFIMINMNYSLHSTQLYIIYVIFNK